MTEAKSKTPRLILARGETQFTKEEGSGRKSKLQIGREINGSKKRERKQGKGKGNGNSAKAPNGDCLRSHLAEP